MEAVGYGGLCCRSRFAADVGCPVVNCSFTGCYAGRDGVK